MANVLRSGPGKDASVAVHYPAEAVKNEMALEVRLPRETAKMLDLYLRKHRPALVDAPSPYLFPAQNAGPKRPSVMSADSVQRIRLMSVGEFDPEAGPAERATRALLIAYLQAQRALGASAVTLVNQAESLRLIFTALAPERDWTWLLPMIAKLKTAVKSGKNHSDLPPIRELYELGLRLMHLAAGSVKERALMYRNGLAIALLAARPLMRRQNLATIRIEEHLVHEGSDYRLEFSKDEMKGGQRSVAGDANALNRTLYQGSPADFVARQARPRRDTVHFWEGPSDLSARHVAETAASASMSSAMRPGARSRRRAPRGSTSSR